MYQKCVWVWIYLTHIKGYIIRPCASLGTFLEIINTTIYYNNFWAKPKKSTLSLRQLQQLAHTIRPCASLGTFLEIINTIPIAKQAAKMCEPP